jgi:ribosomal protein S18 acetylase RimI-like enzyme
MLDIRIIAASETYPLRHKILRQNEPIEKCVYPFDTAASTVHFGLFEKNALLGIISVFETKNEIFNDQKQFQIRGMAVLENQQKKGYGAALVRHTMAHLQKEKEYLVWFNARIIALGFYEKLGFQITGTEFEIVPIGMHFIMYKRFSLD